MRLFEWIDIFTDTYKKPYLSFNGLECYYNCVRHIKNYFGNCLLSSIKGYQIQQFINSMKAIPNTQHKTVVYFNEILEYACRNRELEYNPMLAIKYKVPSQNHRKAMTVAEQEKFVNSLKDKPYKLLFITYLFTGARRNEIIEPESMQVDFKSNVICLNGTKTKKSKRVVPLFELLKKELLKVKNYKKYFTSFKPDYVTKIFLKHCRAIKLYGFCVHSLRTTFATRCFEAKIDAKTIQNWLGHSKIETTLDIYVDNTIYLDITNNYIVSEIEKFNNYLK